MKSTEFEPVCESLTSLLGREYTEAVVAARAALTGEDRRELRRLAATKVAFFPAGFHRRQLRLLSKVGQVVGHPLRKSPKGAASAAFKEVTKTSLAPLAGCGNFRVGEDGRLYLISKSEHYHAPLGHSFPGYRLLDLARQLGIPNATHNNTRGFITRRLEEELIRTANGWASPSDVRRGGRSRSPAVLNRVLNLETGSVACEAAMKMMLARFYRPQADAPAPRYHHRVPVFIVIGNDQGGLQANYHGTAVVAQLMRGMWADLLAAIEKAGTLKVVALRPNRLAEAEEAFARYDRPPYKVAGFLHELVMMNYGAVCLDPPYVRSIYRLCRERDVPTMCDEIQSCLWSPRLYLYREYGLAPGFVCIGKGFPGGEYAASRILFNAQYDCLPQFGALVTNGQEELASLTYLVTMQWAEANSDVTREVGDYYEQRLHEWARKHRGIVTQIAGRRHMQGIHFQALEPAKAFAKALNEAGLDISAQVYKTDCPPVALTKLPLIAGYEVVDMVLDKMQAAMSNVLRNRARPG